MFERFTDRARKVMALANQEAQRFNHEYIATEHILLGLVKEGSGTGACALKNLGVDLRAVRLAVEKLVTSGPDMVTVGKLPQTQSAKKVIECALIEARNLHHNYVGTEHMLLGLLREQDGIAAQVLASFNLNLEALRTEVLNLLGGNDKSEEPTSNQPERAPSSTSPDALGARFCLAARGRSVTVNIATHSHGTLGDYYAIKFDDSANCFGVTVTRRGCFEGAYRCVERLLEARAEALDGINSVPQGHVDCREMMQYWIIERTYNRFARDVETAIDNEIARLRREQSSEVNCGDVTMRTRIRCLGTVVSDLRPVTEEVRRGVLSPRTLRLLGELTGAELR